MEIKEVRLGSQTLMNFFSKESIFLQFFYNSPDTLLTSLNDIVGYFKWFVISEKNIAQKVENPKENVKFLVGKGFVAGC